MGPSQNHTAAAYWMARLRGPGRSSSCYRFDPRGPRWPGPARPGPL